MNLNNVHILHTPSRKINNELNYKQIESDHHPSIMKRIPRSIEKRMTMLSVSEKSMSLQFTAIVEGMWFETTCL